VAGQRAHPLRVAGRRPEQERAVGFHLFFVFLNFLYFFLIL
jgi:hypothetical protein